MSEGKTMQTSFTIKRHAIKGFTLVELLIVVIILAILAAIVVPQFASSTDDAKISSAKSTLSNLRGAIDLYYQQHGKYPGDLTAVPTKACTGGTSGAGAASTAAALLEQLSLYTDASGGACSISDTTNHKFGPYMKQATFPNDPIKGVSTVTVVTAGNLNMVGGGTTGGWRYDTKTGKLIIDNTTLDSNGVGYDKY